MAEKKINEGSKIAMFGHKRWSREGGVEIVVKELCTRMAQKGCEVTCYNRSGHHVSGVEYDSVDETEYKGGFECIRTFLKNVPGSMCEG